MSAPKVCVGQVTRWLSGGTPSRSVSAYWTGEIPWISASTLKQIEISESDQHLTPEGVAVGSKMAPIGSTLFLVRGSALYNEIRAGLVVKPVCFNQDVKALVPDSSVEPKFLTYSLLGRAEYLLKLVSTAGNSAGVLDTKLVQAFEIWLPPRAEQRAIAGALGDVDALLGALDQLIAKKRDLKQAAMQQLLTGQTRLPGFHSEWEVKRLGERANFRTGPFGSALHKSDYTDDGIPIINPMHIVDSRLVPSRTMTVTVSAAEALSDFRLESGDIIIGRRGDMGRCAVVQEDQSGWLCGTGSMIIRCADDAIPSFLQRVLSSPKAVAAIEDASVGTTMINLNQSVLNGLIIEFPSPDEQTAIAEVLTDMDAELAALEQRRAKTRALKQGMMQELLTGKTRLV